MKTSPRELTHTDHTRHMEGMTYVYPVLSRRAGGVSIGINLSPGHGCNFNCVYCQVEGSGSEDKHVFPEIIGKELALLFHRITDGSFFSYPPLDTLDPAFRQIHDVAFSGNGEPTAAREFKEVVQIVVDLKKKFGLDSLKIVLITNGSLLHRPQVVEALALMDQAQGEVWAKLDAGDPSYYRQVNRSQVDFQRIIDNLTLTARLRPIVIQSLFMRINGSGPSNEEIAAYIHRLETILQSGGQLKYVQVYTVARKPRVTEIQALSNSELETIARQIEAQVPIQTRVIR